MDEKLREKLVAGFERAVLVAGAGNYEEGIDTARKLVGKMHEYISRIRTVDELRLVLDECPPFPSWRELRYCFSSTICRKLFESA